MRISRILVALATLIVGTLALAEHHETMEKPSFSVSQSTMITAMVMAINHETREVTLGMDEGETFTFTASPEALNLNQVAVGDIVHAKRHSARRSVFDVISSVLVICRRIAGSNCGTAIAT